jgi:hypothetical protein
VCLLPIKPPSDFNSGFKVSHGAILISYKVESTVFIMPSHSQCRPVWFPFLNVLFYLSLVLTADKATVRFYSGMKCYMKNCSLLAVKSALFSHHTNCFSGHVYQNGRVIMTVILQAISHTHTNAPLYYWKIGIF